MEQIRKNERDSHTELYSTSGLYEPGSWLQKPIKTVTDLLGYFEDRFSLRVLDLGCGVGRNCIAIAKHFSHISCRIDCVDILELAIEKLMENAEFHGVSSGIHGIVSPIDDYAIGEDSYDLILAVSALEHVDSTGTFSRKLEEIRRGTRKDGIVCLVVNSDVRESDKETGAPLPPQFEVNLTTEELQSILANVFSGWKVLKSTVRQQRYDIPRGDRTSDLQTNVVTYVICRHS